MEKRNYVLRARGPFHSAKDSATHPEALKRIIEEMLEGIDILDNELPNLWLIAATDEAIEKLKEQIHGWTISPKTEEYGLNPPRPPRPQCRP